MIVPHQRTGAPQGPPPTRKTAVFAWVALLFGVFMFTAIATGVGAGAGAGRGGVAQDGLTRVALGLSPVALLASRVLPRRLKPAQQPATPEALAMSRIIVAAALNEGAAMFAIIAWMVEGHPVVGIAVAISIAGLLATFPTEARWRAAGAREPARAAAHPRNRLVR